MRPTELKKYAIASAKIHRNLKFLMTLRQTVAILTQLNISPDESDKLTLEMFTNYWTDKISKFHAYVGFNFNTSIQLITQDKDGCPSHTFQRMILSLADSSTVTKVLNLYKMQDTDDGIYVGRPSVFGNPKPIEKGETFDEVKQKEYKDWALNDDDFCDNLPYLHGYNLICFCEPKPCHAEVISQIDMETIDVTGRGITPFVIETFLITLTGTSPSIRAEWVNKIIPPWTWGYNHQILKIADTEDVSLYLAVYPWGYDELLKQVACAKNDLKNQPFEIPNTSIERLQSFQSITKAPVLSGFSSLHSKQYNQIRVIDDKSTWIGGALKQLIEYRDASKVGFTEFEIDEINKILGKEVKDKRILDELETFRNGADSPYYQPVKSKKPLFDQYVEMTKRDDYLCIAIDDTDYTTPIFHTNLPIDLKSIPWNSYESNLSEVLNTVFTWVGGLIHGNTEIKQRPIYLAVKSMTQMLSGAHYVIECQRNSMQTNTEIGNIHIAKISCTKMLYAHQYTFTHLSKHTGLSVSTYGFCYDFTDDKSKTWLKMSELTSKILARKINLFSFDSENSCIASNGLNSTYMLTFLPRTASEHANIFNIYRQEPPGEIDICITDKGPFTYTASAILV